MSGDPKFLSFDEAMRRVEAISPGGGMGGLIAAMEAAGDFGGHVCNGQVVGMDHGDPEWAAAEPPACDHGRAR